MLQSMGSQRLEHDLVNEKQQHILILYFYSLCRPSCYKRFYEIFWNLSESALEEESLERQQRQISLHFACQFSFRRRMFLQLKEW